GPRRPPYTAPPRRRDRALAPPSRTRAPPRAVVPRPDAMGRLESGAGPLGPRRGGQLRWLIRPRIPRRTRATLRPNRSPTEISSALARRRARRPRASERRPSGRRGAPGAADLARPVAEDVVAPMLGKVLRLAAEPGARVKEDETLLVMEAMKMEIQVVAPRDGTLTAFRVAPGDAVDAGDVIAVLD